MAGAGNGPTPCHRRVPHLLDARLCPCRTERPRWAHSSRLSAPHAPLTGQFSPRVGVAECVATCRAIRGGFQSRWLSGCIRIDDAIT
ncbi:hypothetical protein VFPFJ_08609 [Purpureocillium lilacinum]|uniref:Uncharacterized protein n=1 Tax=Purpureocillium lilacinum TaxID=33203 RepID=A0A179GXW0_PURLI|nr:hypothetical protein VFPFJ_08609 [Purpureocillium lilacinum]OAQ82806.1 hypothetical protein VFPFJ_08609 [Purpureocillium lilacinum]